MESGPLYLYLNLICLDRTCPTTSCRRFLFSIKQHFTNINTFRNVGKVCALDAR